MAERRIILHVGTHKTGTSSFQASLAANRARLEADGIVPVARKGGDGRPGAEAYNLAGLANLFIRPDLATPPRLRAPGREPKPEEAARRRRLFARRLAEDPAETLLLSAEGFCYLRSAEEAGWMRDFLAETGRAAQILLVLRGEAGWRQSWRNQLARDTRVRRALGALPEARRPDGEWYFDRAALTGFWAGQGALTVVDYDAALAADGSVLPALYRALGVDPAGLDLDFHQKRRRWYAPLLAPVYRFVKPLKKALR
ncbi:MAG: hypothetical protein D6801_04355 [Alphaproteobacteria bacterium]|nr:MAG: hypothetical protein D6801_04355 [Alphaproteobacteria bacterium]